MPEYKSLTDLEINPCPFDILTPDHNLTKIMVLQCSGAIDTAGHVINVEAATSTSKHSKFLSLALEKEASLAITPEYSCPWSVIEDFVSDPLLFPKQGSLWALGCESVTPDELVQIKARTEDQVLWIHEDLAAAGDRIFFSPLVYLFRLEDGSDKSLCAIVQFKTHQMGGTHFERDYLIQGNIRYIIHNPTMSDSIRLMSIICSDAIVFDINDLTDLTPYLLIHIQLNTDPYHTNVSSYRTSLFESGKGQNVEILSLNWAQGFQFLGQAQSLDYGGSAYFMHPIKSEKEPLQKDHAIDANHAKGVYLRFSKKTRHAAFLLSPKELIFELNTTKVSQHLAQPVNQSRSGITAVATYSWQGDQAVWGVVDEIDDGVRNTFEANGGKVQLRPSLREKFLTICSGRVCPEMVEWHMPPDLDEEDKKHIRISRWHRVRNMASYCLDGFESPKGTSARLKHCQDEEIAQSVSNYTSLLTYIGNKDIVPEILYDLANGVPIVELIPDEVTKEKIRHNVRLNSGGGLATIVFIGSALPEAAKRKFADIKNTLSPQRLVVWYYYQGKIQFITDELPQIIETDQSLEDITRAEL